MSLDIYSKKLILPLILIQRLDHVDVNDAGVEWALDLEITISQNTWYSLGTILCAIRGSSSEDVHGLAGLFQ
jgi:hypothetical protein